MKIIGNITKSTRGQYTVTIKADGGTVFKKSKINHIEDARDILYSNKRIIVDNKEYIRSFSELEGKIIKFKNRGLSYSAKVVGCDFWVGITLVHHKDSNRYATCLKGPLSPFAKAHPKSFEKLYNDYVEYFASRVKAIESGVYDIPKLFGECNSTGRPTSADCAFGS